MRRLCTLAAVLALGVGVAACDEEGGDDARLTGASAIAATDSDGEQLNCRRDLPPPSVAGDVKGAVTLLISNFGYEFIEGRNRYTHERRFRETGGVGVTIYRGKVCVDEGRECADACVTYRVPAGASLQQADHHVATKRDQDRITIKYWARDDAGNLFQIDRVIETEGKTAEVVE